MRSARGGSAYKSATSQKGSVIRGARANPMHCHSLGELASEEPSESGRNIGTLHLRKPLPLQRRHLARSCNAIGGANKTWLVNCASTEG